MPRNIRLSLFLCCLCCLATQMSVWGEPSGDSRPTTTTTAAIIADDLLILGCEQAETRLVLLDSRVSWDKPEALVWEWRVKSEAALPDEHKKMFAFLSDAKRVRGGRQIVTVASGGGVALVNVESASLAWYGDAGTNTHSAAMLPGELLATVSSTGKDLRLFDLRSAQGLPAEPVAIYPLPGGHGAEWDAKRECLWALGDYELNRYEIDRGGDCPALKMTKTYHARAHRPNAMPEAFDGGHDLAPIPGQDKYWLTDNPKVWVFDPAAERFELEPNFADRKKVKSVGQHPRTKQIILMQATENWWSDTVRSPDGQWTRTLPNARFYKARWWVD